jgi:hypothetical protein
MLVEFLEKSPSIFLENCILSNNFSNLPILFSPVVTTHR